MHIRTAELTESERCWLKALNRSKDADRARARAQGGNRDISMAFVITVLLEHDGKQTTTAGLGPVDEVPAGEAQKRSK